MIGIWVSAKSDLAYMYRVSDYVYVQAEYNADWNIIT